jgi:hypothetical protein
MGRKVQTDSRLAVPGLSLATRCECGIAGPVVVAIVMAVAAGPRDAVDVVRGLCGGDTYQLLLPRPVWRWTDEDRSHVRRDTTRGRPSLGVQVRRG